MSPIPADDLSLPTERDLYEAVIGVLEEGVILFDPQGRVLTCNPAAEAILDLDLKQMKRQPLTDSTWNVVDEVFNPVEKADYPVFRSFETARSATAVMGVYQPSGALRWLRVNAQPITKGDRTPYVSVSFSDITESREVQRRFEREARFRETLIEIITESLAQGLDERFYQRMLECAVRSIPSAQAGSLLLLDGERYKFVAAVDYDLDSLQEIYLLPEEMYRGSDTRSLLLVYGFDNAQVPEVRRGVIDGAGRAGDIKVCMSIPVIVDGVAVAYFSLDNFEDAAAYDEGDIAIGQIFAQHTGALWQRFRLERRLEQLAFYDGLTGLPNRALLYERLERALSRRHRDRPLAVMLLDLDNFKHINDTFGHDAGDTLLQGVAKRLGAVVRLSDTLARWGGDEFVLLTELDHADAADAVAEKVLGILEHPFELGGRAVHARGSLGVEVIGSRARSPLLNEIIKHADIALYQAKGSGRNTYRRYTPAMTQHLQAQLTLEHDLQEAIAQDAFELDFQPRFDLATGEVTSIEALTRWRHPLRGLVSPSIFIPLAEENGSITALGELVLGRALRQARLWRSAGILWRVSVNISARQLAYPDFVDGVQKRLAEHGLEPSDLELEITESAAVAQMKETVRDLKRLRAAGIQIALDDFGTGYSSLTHLRQLPLDVLKLDRAFVRDLGEGHGEGTEIARTIVHLGRSLNLKVVAEGVETETQLDQLRSLGCHEVQGYFLAYPQSASELEGLRKHLPIAALRSASRSVN